MQRQKSLSFSDVPSQITNRLNELLEAAVQQVLASEKKRAREISLEGQVKTKIQKVDQVMSMEMSPQGSLAVPCVEGEASVDGSLEVLEEKRYEKMPHQGSTGVWNQFRTRSMELGQTAKSKDEVIKWLVIQNFPEKEKEGSWEEKYFRLKEFQEEYGHCNVTASKDKQLARWVSKQREKNKSGVLSVERVQQLNNLEFHWASRTLSPWEENYNRLKEFKEANGHCNITAKMEKKLNMWIHNQRQAKKEGKLSDDRVQKLEELGVRWSVIDGTSAKPLPWEEQLENLRRYKKIHGHCNVTRGKDKKLHRWVTKQREKYKIGTLSQDRISKLEELGFQWTIQGPLVSWEESFNKLKAFKDANGHCYVTPKTDKQLYNWTKNRQNDKKTGKLTEEQIAQLESIGFQWTRTDCFLTSLGRGNN